MIRNIILSFALAFFSKPSLAQTQLSAVVSILYIESDSTLIFQNDTFNLFKIARFDTVKYYNKIDQFGWSIIFDHFKEIYSRDGNFIAFYDSAYTSPMVKCTVVNGKLHGKLYGYYRNGLIDYERNYIGGKRNGLFVGYDECGGIQNISEYKNDMQTGLFVQFCEPYKLCYHQYFKKGLQHGESKWWDKDKDGNYILKRHIIYKRGRAKKVIVYLN